MHVAQRRLEAPRLRALLEGVMGTDTPAGTTYQQHLLHAVALQFSRKMRGWYSM